MVWGMSMPSGFGEFFPDGEFVGWRECLKTYYGTQMPEEQKALFDDGRGNGANRYAYHVSEKLKREPGSCLSQHYPPFGPVEPHETPKSFRTAKRHASLGSLVALNDSILAVDEALKGIIERLEPGVHRFFPVETSMPGGAAFPRAHHILFIGRFFDSFSPERSDYGSWRPDGPDHYFHEPNKKGMAGLAFSRAIFGDAHLWRERRMSSLLTCLSDELRTEIAKARLRTPKLCQMKEI